MSSNLRVIDHATRSFHQMRKAVEVPEWTDENGETITLYFPPFTSKDSDAVDEIMREKYGPEAEWPEQERRARRVVHQAQLEDGSMAFSQGDVPLLMDKVPSVIMSRLYIEMVKVGVSLEGLVGKSEASEAEKADTSSEGSTTDTSSPSA